MAWNNSKSGWTGLVLDNARKQAVVIAIRCLCGALNLFSLFKQNQTHAFSD